ncbi:UDP-3-O-(3-hydroxymyristoyl)glucosamine N-acyltransferase [Rariglobus hedericola]|uniref:UDP-3-O-acylglucosamine N-acyltransferase n=1 Tax=Rariglobus hedericola TaxID=2597822 RepID=A0A556QLG3_9BACT|nr:UDP-3-O-(3-hydroxymyristoyl)glucosamine N-acyltransferase [Rariglobus hedericola]TSJ77442.1 UDP-3-O-(3-hydroxymyristoyl)glucosamine N-acyltransferase [Rariglobus hedericola]
MQLAFSAAEIAVIVQPLSSKGSTSATVQGIASLSSARPGDLSFLGNPKYKTEVAATTASIVLLPPDYTGEPAPDQQFLFVEKPSVALARLCARIEQLLWPKPAPGIHPTAVIAADAHIDASATIGPMCVIEEGVVIGARTHVQAQAFIGRNARIGADCWLMPRVSVSTECVIKDRVRLQVGVIIGSDGFGYEFMQGRHEKVPQVGNVVLENDVEIGANSTLDRARFSRTVIGEGTKIDNLVQIGHNVVIGKHCLICAQAGVSGSTTIEDYVVLGGQAGIAGHLTIGKGSKVDGQTGVNSDLAPGSFVKGSPCMPYNLEQRFNVLKKKLPDLFKRVDALETVAEELKKSSAA